MGGCSLLMVLVVRRGGLVVVAVAAGPSVVMLPVPRGRATVRERGGGWCILVKGAWCGRVGVDAKRGRGGWLLPKRAGAAPLVLLRGHQWGRATMVVRIRVLHAVATATAAAATAAAATVLLLRRLVTAGMKGKS